MTSRALAIAALLSTCGLAACATAPASAPVAAQAAVAPVEAVPPAPAESEHDKLFSLFKASDEATLQRNPLNALFRGDLRYADRFGDYISDQYYAAERAAAEQDLAALRTIDRSKLSATDQLAYDTFE